MNEEPSVPCNNSCQPQRQKIANSRGLAIRGLWQFAWLLSILHNFYEMQVTRSQVEITRAGQEAPARASDEQLLPLRWCTSFCWPCCLIWPWVRQKTTSTAYLIAHQTTTPQKLEILHVYLFGGYGNPCATQNASANKKVHRVRFQRLWTDYGLHRFTDNSDWTLFFASAASLISFTSAHTLMSPASVTGQLTA